MDAVSLQAGVVVGDGWLPVTAAAMAIECQQAPSREAEAASERWQQLPRLALRDLSRSRIQGKQYGKREGGARPG